MNLAEALNYLSDWPPGPVEEAEMEDVLIDALKESQRRRVRNSEAGGAVVKELRRRGRSYTWIEEVCGIPRGTAHRWWKKPEPGPEEPL